MIERKISGITYSVNGIIQDNRIYFFIILKKNENNFNLSRYDLVYKINECDPIIKESRKIVKLLKINNTLFDLDIKKNNNKYYLIEFGIHNDRKIDTIFFYNNPNYFNYWIKLQKKIRIYYFNYYKFIKKFTFKRFYFNERKINNIKNNSLVYDMDKKDIPNNKLKSLVFIK